MKPSFLRLLHPLVISALLLGGRLPLSAEQAASPADPIVQLEPYNVQVSYSTIEVRFRLSGAQLFAPADDPIREARVISVWQGDSGDDGGLQPQDVLLGVNGRALTGLSLREIAAVVAAARREPRQLWQVRRGLAVINVLHDGAWRPALPGLER